MDNEGDDQMMELVQNVLQNSDVSSAELKYLLECREKGKIDFTLIDIREIFEYTSLSINTVHVNTDDERRYVRNKLTTKRINTSDNRTTVRKF